MLPKFVGSEKQMHEYLVQVGCIDSGQWYDMRTAESFREAHDFVLNQTDDTQDHRIMRIYREVVLTFPRKGK